MSTINDTLYKPLSREDTHSQVLVINRGSSSLKLTLFQKQKENLTRLLDAQLKNMNEPELKLEISFYGGQKNYSFQKKEVGTNKIEFIFEKIKQIFNISFETIQEIGHRFVHGGDQYTSSIIVDDSVLNHLKTLIDLAPLHNEACLTGINECLEYFGKTIPQVSVFDTAFHHSLPKVASNYAIPYELASKYKIKRYGFHGISHAFLWDHYAKINENTITEKSKIITLHLGNGCSMAAIKGGRSIDTTMGFTPAEGLIMGTRAGDIDAAVVDFLCLHEEKTVSEIMNLLNFKSGLLGISELSSNLEILLSEQEKNEQANLAIEMFCYRIVKYLGAYLTILGGAEAFIFSGGIGENAAKIRKKIIEKMSWIGVELDDERNNLAIKPTIGSMQRISASTSTITVYVAATDENLFIAKESIRLC